MGRVAAYIAANALVLAITMGCSGSDGGRSSDSAGTGAVGADSGADTGGDAAPLLVTCTPVAGGVGAVSVNNAAARQYYVDLPTDTSKPMALMFSWHGYNQAPIDFKNMVGMTPADYHKSLQ